MDEDPSGLELAYDSGNSAKLIRLGVERPELGLLPPNASATPAPSISGMLFTGEGGGFGDGGTERCLSEEWRGGEGGRVDDVCVGLVNRRETEAVAVEVEASARGAEEISKGGGWTCENAGGGGGGGCSSRILRSALTVCLAGQPSEEDEDSSMGGVMQRRGVTGTLGVRERERRDSVASPEVGEIVRRRPGLVCPRSVLELRWKDERGDASVDDGVDEPDEEDLTKEESMLYARVLGSCRSVNTGEDRAE